MYKLKEGWLKQDVERAAQRVDEWGGKATPYIPNHSYEKDLEAYQKYLDSLKPEKWDRRFLELAKHISTWSKDESTKTGCVVVDDKRRVVSIGYNGFPRHVNDDIEKYKNRETKYKLICHADRNALDNAPCSVEGMTMYITHPPCTECQKSIIQKGIRRVVWYKAPEEFKQRWGDGFEILAEPYRTSNIQVTTYETI